MARIEQRRLAPTAAALAAAGCVAADEEAAELAMAAGRDDRRLAALVARRCAGEPLAWITGSVRFCGETVLVHPGVYVPRPQSEELARLAVARLPARGTAVDLCTGAGALAVVLARRRPAATVVGTDVDPLALACARANGVRVVLGDMATALPEAMRGAVDVVVGVVPYVPTAAIRLLPSDARDHEPRRSLDGGPDGTTLLRRAAEESASLLRPGGWLLLELGGDQAAVLRPVVAGLGYSDLRVLEDEEGDPRGIAARR